MYIAKIPGTRYVTSLESQGGQWYLRIKLEDVVEAEEEVNQMSKKILHSKLNDLFKQVNVQINSFQHDLIHKEIVAQIGHLLGDEAVTDTSADPSGSEISDTKVKKEDPRVDELLEKVEKLENTLNSLQDRIDRIEAISNNN